MFLEFFNEKSKGAYLNYFRQDEKKFKQTRIIMAALFALVALMFAYIVGKPLFWLVVPVAIFVGYKLPYFSLINKKKNQDLMVSFIFPDFLQSFMATMTTEGNVYQTLKKTIQYTEEPLKSELEKLVKKIEEGGTRDDFMEFAYFIGSPESTMIIDMIYQFNEFGVKKDALDNLQRYIQSLQENKRDELIERKMRGMDIFGFTPLFISMIFFFGYAGIIAFYYLQDIMEILENTL